MPSTNASSQSAPQCTRARRCPPAGRCARCRTRAAAAGGARGAKRSTRVSTSMPGSASWTARNPTTPHRPPGLFARLTRLSRHAEHTLGGAPAVPGSADDAGLPEAALLQRLQSTRDGLTDTDADARRQQYGPNQVGRDTQPNAWLELGAKAKNPLNALLLALAAISWATGDARAAGV